MTPGEQLVAVLAGEHLDADDLAGLAVRHLERGVPHLARLLAEDRAEQLLLGRELGLALGGDLADQDVAGLDLGADADDAVLVQVLEYLLLDVGDVRGYLLVAELGVAGLDLVLLDVDRGEQVVAHQPLADEDGVLEVVAFPGHERDQQVAAQGQLALVGAGAVGDDLALCTTCSPSSTMRPLVDAGALVGAAELLELVERPSCRLRR